MILTIDADDTELRAQHDEWHAASRRDRVAEALLDENGLRFTEAALDVIMAVVDSVDYIDENGVSPASVRDYALDAERALRIVRKNR